jgi:RNA polymerase sigma-70 factor (ECF subfamily)
MEDSEIVALYWTRSADAVTESEAKYGTYCSAVALRILDSHEDAEECVNDTWLRAWESIPPQRPASLTAFFGTITRNLALDRRRKSRTGKAGGGTVALCLDELAECVGTEDSALESAADRIALREALNRFLGTLKPMPRELFMRRYWGFSSERDISRSLGISVGAVKMSLGRTRKKLRDYLKREGIEV